MSTLYRSPAIIIDRHEWHAVVLLDHGRISQHYRWRPVSLKPQAWHPITDWVGPRPKKMYDRFHKFRQHIKFAMESELRRREVAKMLEARVAA